MSHYSLSLFMGISLLTVACLDASAPPSNDQSEPDQTLDMEMMPDQALIDMTSIEVDQDIDMRPLAEIPIKPAEAVVKLSTEATLAGELNRISCLIYGDDGQVLPYDPEWGTPRYDIRPLDGWQWDNEAEGIIIGEKAQQYQVKCLMPSLGLRSSSRPWLVQPASLQKLVARVDQDIYVAGDTVNALCEGYDRYENPIANLEMVTWRSRPELNQLAANSQSELSAQITIADRYELNCVHPEMSNVDSTAVNFDVLPNLPANLRIFFASGRQVFSIGDIIQVRHELTDIYGNQVQGVVVEQELLPSLPSFGEGNYQASSPGIYEVSVSVMGDTHEQMSLEDTRSFRVEDGAPQITCDTPLFGAMTRMGAQQVSGQVQELSTVSSFTVNGIETELDTQGRFNTSILPEWGLNVVELVAEDQFRNQSVQHCMFFASAVYLSESIGINDVALLHLDQAAIDDGSPRSPINSLGDLLGEILNSSELVTTINQSLQAINPILPTTCYANTFFGCAFSAGVRYNSSQMNGPNSVSLELTTGGVNLDATIRNISMSITASGRVTGINWSQAGSVAVQSIRVETKLGISVSGGIPQVRVVGTPTVTIGNITLSLNIGVSVVQSVLNTFLNFVFDAFEGLIVNQVSSLVESFITTEVDTVLSSALNSLDFEALGFDLSLPRPLGNGTYALSLDFALNRINTNSNRMQIGMRSTVGGQRLNLANSSGIPVPSGSRVVELDPGFFNDAAGAVNIGLMNSILHRLWRGNYFEVSQSPEAFGDDIDFTMNLMTPPAMELVGTQKDLRLHFGPAMVQLNIPALFSEELNLLIGGWASSSVNINRSNELLFEPITIDDLVISSPTVQLNTEALDSIEELVVTVIQDVLNDALNQALPVFPIPEFALPNSLNAYGVPNGTVLRVENLSLSNDAARLIVKGNLR